MLITLLLISAAHSRVLRGGRGWTTDVSDMRRARVDPYLNAIQDTRAFTLLQLDRQDSHNSFCDSTWWAQSSQLQLLPTPG